ncbi:hypothetical protein ACWC5C_20615 [Streptomyces sp. NPDC001700]
MNSAADTAVGGYAVQLAKQAGAFVITTAGPRSSGRVTAEGADEVIDHTTADVVAAVSEPVDVVLNLAPPSWPRPTEASSCSSAGALTTNVRRHRTSPRATPLRPKP